MGGFSTPHPVRFTSGNEPVPTVGEGGWAPRDDLNGCGIPRGHGVRKGDLVTNCGLYIEKQKSLCQHVLGGILNYVPLQGSV